MLNIEQKVDSAEKRALIEGKPTENYFQANEFNAMVNAINANIQDLLNQGASIDDIYTKLPTGLFRSVATPSSTPTGTGEAFWFATQPGTYTNYGGVVVNANSYALIGRDASGNFSISQTAFTDFSTTNSYNVLKSADFLIQKNRNYITNNKFKIVPLSLQRVQNTLDHKTAETWYRWDSDKILNTISIPLMRSGNYSGTFTQDVKLRVAVNNTFVLSRTITVAEINAKGLNSTTTLTPIDNLFFDVQLPIFEFKSGDVVYIGIECGGTDKMGYVYTSNATGEWGNRYYLRTSNNISSYTSVPSPSGTTDFALAIKFGYNDYIKEQIKGVVDAESVIQINSRNINSFIGATNTVIDYLLAAKPRAKFGFISHHNEDGIDTTSDGSLRNLIRAQQALADYWGVPILRLDKKLGWIKRNGKNTLLSNVPDQIHPGTDKTLDAIRQYKVLCVEFLKQFYDNYTGKKVAWYGTSIPFGFPVNNDTTRYPNQAVTALGGTILNKAVSGSSIRRYKFNGTNLATNISFLDVAQVRNYQNAMLDLIGTIDEPDLFIFDFGINDFVGDSTDFEFNLSIK